VTLTVALAHFNCSPSSHFGVDILVLLKAEEDLVMNCPHRILFQGLLMNVATFGMCSLQVPNTHQKLIYDFATRNAEGFF
jgi:hypothetical protein